MVAYFRNRGRSFIKNKVFLVKKKKKKVESRLYTVYSIWCATASSREGYSYYFAMVHVLSALQNPVEVNYRLLFRKWKCLACPIDFVNPIYYYYSFVVNGFRSRNSVGLSQLGEALGEALGDQPGGLPSGRLELITGIWVSQEVAKKWLPGFNTPQSSP